MRRCLYLLLSPSSPSPASQLDPEDGEFHFCESTRSLRNFPSVLSNLNGKHNTWTRTGASQAWDDGQKNPSPWKDSSDTWHCLFVPIPQGHSGDTTGSCLPAGAFPSWRSKTRGWMVGLPALQNPGCLGIWLGKR